MTVSSVTILDRGLPANTLLVFTSVDLPLVTSICGHDQEVQVGYSGCEQLRGIIDLSDVRKIINLVTQKNNNTNSRWTVNTTLSSVNSSGRSTMSYLTCIGSLMFLLLIIGCSTGGAAMTATESAMQKSDADDYVIGPGDRLQVFVWGHDDLTSTVTVRPDGEMSTPLVEDMRAAGKTPTELARAVENVLSDYVRTPTVTIIVQQFVGEYDRQIRVVGQATEPQALSYRNGMTLLDVMIEVGGLSEFASGNKAKIVRKKNGGEEIIKVRINDLLNKGRMDQNVRMMPGDVLIIPESIF